MIDKTLYRPGPPDVTIERLPSGAIDAVATFPVIAPDRPEWLVCDCCLGHVNRLWFYRQLGFCMRIGRNRLELQEGHWSFCVYCDALWRTRDIPMLLDRVLTLNPECKEFVEVAYPLLPYVIYGEPQIWNGGEPRPKAGQ